MPGPATFLVLAGIGMPSLLHAGAGAFVTPRLSVEARYANTVFNHLVGVGATGWLLGQAEGRPPRHSLALTGDAMVNLWAEPLSLASGGDRLGSYAGAWAGWGFVGERGFVLRAQAGGLFYADSGFAAGPDARLALGWTWIRPGAPPG